MENTTKKRGRPIGTKVGRRNQAKILFRENWDRLFSHLTEKERKIYPTIIQTAAAVSGMTVPTKREIYNVQANRNNYHSHVLEALAVYLQSKEANLECV